MLNFLIKKSNVDLGALAETPFWLFDINQRALDHIGYTIGRLKSDFGLVLKVALINSDFLQCPLPEVKGRSTVFFGNPPFTRNASGSTYKNAFADFTERCLEATRESGSVSLITPLSICFSRDYKSIRHRIRSSGKIHYFFNFDNIPDSLFKSGKARHINTNKANSQRCTVFTATDRAGSQLFSSGLIRWPKGQREVVLGQIPTYFDCKNYHLDDQIPRPASSEIVDRFVDWKSSLTIRSLTLEGGPFKSNVGGVARNFIAFRDFPDTSTVTIGFPTETLMMQALCIISSRKFYDYWRTLGDGFHVTLKNILSYPIDQAEMLQSEKQSEYFRELWCQRYKYSKVKKNAGKNIVSFDFSSVRSL